MSSCVHVCVSVVSSQVVCAVNGCFKCWLRGNARRSRQPRDPAGWILTCSAAGSLPPTSRSPYSHYPGCRRPGSLYTFKWVDDHVKAALTDLTESPGVEHLVGDGCTSAGALVLVPDKSGWWLWPGHRRLRAQGHEQQEGDQPEGRTSMHDATTLF